MERGGLRAALFFFGGVMSLLQEAETIINGERQMEYGEPVVNFARIADLWSVILGRKIQAIEVVQCMCAVKMARLVATPDHRDSWRDIIGYAALSELVTVDQPPLKKSP